MITAEDEKKIAQGTQLRGEKEEGHGRLGILTSVAVTFHALAFC